MMDFTVTSDYKVNLTEIEKNKFLDLTGKMELWNTKVQVISVIVGIPKMVMKTLGKQPE